MPAAQAYKFLCIADVSEPADETVPVAVLPMAGDAAGQTAAGACKYEEDTQ